jgi:multiple sugar transport system substrate-binding protein
MKQKNKILVLVLMLTVMIIIYYFINKYFVKRDFLFDEYGEKEEFEESIVFSYGSDDCYDIFKNNIKSFEKHYKIKVITDNLSSNCTNYRLDHYKKKLPENDKIDVIFADIAWIQELVSLDLILPLNKYFLKEDQKDILNNMINICMQNDKVYAVPNRADAPFLYYRSDIIKSPPKTYEELKSTAKKYLNYPGIEYGYVFQGDTYEGLVCNSLEFIWNNGGDIIDNNKVVLNSEKSIQGLGIFVDLVNSEICSKDVLKFKENDSIYTFKKGHALFMRNWPYVYEILNDDVSKVKGKVGIAKLPLGPQGKKSIGTMGGWNYVINKNSKNPEAAWNFIKWMTAYKSQLKNCEYSILPTRKSIYNSDEAKEKNPLLKFYTEGIKNTKSRPFTKNYSDISESMQDNFKKAINKRITPKDAIINISSDLEKNLFGE